MVVSVGRIRHALGDGASVEQARAVLGALRRAGLLDGSLTGSHLVGVAEIATLTGRSASAVCQWRGFPEPIARLRAGRIYDVRDVQRFIDANPDLVRAPEDAT